MSGWQNASLNTKKAQKCKRRRVSLFCIEDSLSFAFLRRLFSATVKRAARRVTTSSGQQKNTLASPIQRPLSTA